MKQQAYQHRSEGEFEVGGWVLMRLQPYQHMSPKQQKKDNKFAPKYYGPYKVLQRIRSMAYKLELPPSSHVHPIFHVSCLKKVIGDNILVQTILPNINEEREIILELETILEIRVKKMINLPIIEYLVKWKNLPIEKVTWEDEFFMQKHLHLIKC
jgi:hypothetical protein